MSIFELDLQAAKYFDIVAKIAALEDEKKALQAVFQKAMVEIEQEEITGHNWRCTWHNTKTERIDTKALKEKLPEVFKEYSKVTTSTRFTLNQIKTA